MTARSGEGRLNVWIAPVAFLLIVGGFWQQREIGRLRVEHEVLLGLARTRGIDPHGPISSGNSKLPRRDRSGEVLALTEDLIRRAQGSVAYRTDLTGQADLVDRLDALNPAQRKEMIGILLATEEMPEPYRLGMIFGLLDRLADDFPEEALALTVEMESRMSDPQCPQQYEFRALRSTIAGRFAERAPEAAWKWFIGARDGWDENWTRATRYAMLGGIGRRDPSAALRMADEAGVDDIGFLAHHCRTLDQKVAALTALRTWSGDDGVRKVKLQEYIIKQTLKSPHDEPNRFEAVAGWIERAALTTGEASFLVSTDLCYYIDPRDTGKWIEWLDRTFSEEQATRQMKRLIDDSRTRDAAKAWLNTLPPEQAAALQTRLAGE